MSDRMKPEDVPAELVEAAAAALSILRHGIPGGCGPHTRNEVRHALAAVLPEVKRQSHRAGYEMARDDMVSGAFIGGPTYEALRDSFTGRRIAQEALEEFADSITPHVCDVIEDGPRRTREYVAGVARSRAAALRTPDAGVGGGS